MELDVVLNNGTILVGDEAGTRVRSIGLLGGRVAAVSDENLPGRRTFDLEGRTVAPGFHDAHCHTSWFGTSLIGLPLHQASTIEEIYRMVADQAMCTPKGEWIIGSGHHPLRTEGRMPTRRELDRVAPEHPVWLIASSGHASVVNSAVLAMLDLTEAVRHSPLAVDEYGEPTGILEESAHTCVLEQARPYGTADVVSGIARAHDEYLRVGITSVQEAGIGAGLVGYSGSELGAYQDARAQGALKVRTTVMPSGDALHEVFRGGSEGTVLGLDLGIRTGLGDDRLRIGPVKFFTDGSILGGTADLHAGYPADDGDLRPLRYDRGDLSRRLVRAHAAGWQLAVHAQGDGAIDFVLDCFEQAQRQVPRDDPRHRIEHCSVVTAAAVDRMRALGVVPSPQGRFVGVVGDGLLSMLDDRQLSDTYRLRSLLDRGLVVAGSSDRPCTEGRPLWGIHDMVNRRTDGGAHFGPDEAVDPLRAMRTYAHGSAYAIHLEESLGELRPGMTADLVVLSDDPSAVPAERIRHIDVTATAVGGDFLFDSAGTFTDLA